MMLMLAMVGGIALSTTTPVNAQFTGPSVAGNPSTVTETQGARIGSYVTLTGHIVEHQRSDYFTFRDDTGDIRIEVEPDIWRGREVGPETQVRIIGEIDRGVLGRYIWVKSLEVLD